jgi:Protein of unknown function (DUF4230)
MKNVLALAALLLAFALGAGIVWHFTHREAPLPDERALVLRVREVARLQSLDVTLYKKVEFAPDPREEGSLWSAVSQWATYAVHPPRGRAIVFAQAHLGLDLRKLDAEGLRVEGRSVQVVLPKVETQVELLPSETEIIGSNLNSAQTAELFEKARAAFTAQVAADKGLQERAKQSAQSSLRALFAGLGFAQVDFVQRLPPAQPRN